MPEQNRRLLDALPLAAVLTGAALMVVAATQYPGGYHWSEHTIFTLFQPSDPAEANVR